MQALCGRQGFRKGGNGKRGDIRGEVNPYDQKRGNRRKNPTGKKKRLVGGTEEN